MRFFLIKLPHIGQKILIRIVVVRKEIDIPFNQFSLTDKEDLNTHPALIHVIAKYITILKIFCHDSLLSPKGANGLNQITVFRCTFKLHTLGCQSHLTLEFINDFIVLSLEKIRDFLGHSFKIGFILATNCMSHALAYVVVKTDFRRWISTLSERKNPV